MVKTLPRLRRVQPRFVNAYEIQEIQRNQESPDGSPLRGVFYGIIATLLLLALLAFGAGVVWSVVHVVGWLFGIEQ